MRILAIDTSTDRTAVAVVEDGRVIESRFHEDPLAHGEALAKIVTEIKPNLEKIDLVAIGMGPGPFTGLRSGIAFGQSFALARGIPWVGVSSLDALAKQFDGNEFIVQVDARRKEVFYAKFKNGKRVGEVAVTQLSALTKLGIAINTGFPEPLHIAERAKNENIREPIYIRRPDAFPIPKGVKFRPITQLDLVPMSAIEKESFPIDPWSIEQLKEEFSAPGRHYVVAEVSGEVVGYAGVVKRGDSGDVLTLAVVKEHRRKGIGRELLRRLVDWARTNNCEAMMLEVRIGNEEAVPLYTSFGFLEITRRANYYGPNQDAIVMRKELR